MGIHTYVFMIHVVTDSYMSKEKTRKKKRKKNRFSFLLISRGGYCWQNF